MLTLCHVFCKELAIKQVRSVSGNLLRNSIDIIPRGLLFLLLPLIAFCWIHSSSARLDGRRRPGDKNRCIAVYSCQQLIITLKKLDLWPLESTVCRLASVTKERSAKLTLHQELTGPCWTHGWLEALTEEFSAPLLQTTPCIHSHTNFVRVKYSSFFLTVWSALRAQKRFSFWEVARSDLFIYFSWCILPYLGMKDKSISSCGLQMIILCT